MSWWWKPLKSEASYFILISVESCTCTISIWHSCQRRFWTKAQTNILIIGYRNSVGWWNFKDASHMQTCKWKKNMLNSGQYYLDYNWRTECLRYLQISVQRACYKSKELRFVSKLILESYSQITNYWRFGILARVTPKSPREDELGIRLEKQLSYKLDFK